MYTFKDDKLVYSIQLLNFKCPTGKTIYACKNTTENLLKHLISTKVYMAPYNVLYY